MNETPKKFACERNFFKFRFECGRRTIAEAIPWNQRISTGTTQVYFYKGIAENNRDSSRNWPCATMARFTEWCSQIGDVCVALFCSTLRACCKRMITSWVVRRTRLGEFNHSHNGPGRTPLVQRTMPRILRTEAITTMTIPRLVVTSIQRPALRRIPSRAFDRPDSAEAKKKTTKASRILIPIHML